jgi:hypothetical protein
MVEKDNAAVSDLQIPQIDRETLINFMPAKSSGFFGGQGRSSQSSAEECIICLEEFTIDNPKVRTLCQCGENRTNFHYPCLLYWLDQKDTCPTCSSHLYFQVSDN